MFTLWADKDNLAGQVVITDESLVIVTNGYAEIDELHIYFWDELPDVPGHRPPPGQADLTMEHINSNVVEVNITSFSFGYVSIHARMGNGKTAYVGGSNTPDGFTNGRGAWWGYVDANQEPCVPCECTPC